MSDTHILKTKEPFLTDVREGRKDFEYRQYTAQNPKKPARDFKVGDCLWLVPLDGCEGESVVREIKYILWDTDADKDIPIAPGFCVIGLESL
jgi:hypothetical protein